MPAATSSIIRFEGATKVFPGRGNGAEVRAVDEVTLDIREGEIFGVIGQSGAGKSTLVRLINALERTTGGDVVVDGVSLGSLNETRLRPVRAGIGMVFQQFNLLSSRTVSGNVAYPLEVAGWPRAERDARVAELLDFVGLADKAGVYPSTLSGGQKQRVGIARALATNPRILLADEATSALDPETTRDVLDLLQRVNRELGVTVVVITHEMDVVRSICHRVAVMDRGHVVEVGEAYQVFSAPGARRDQALRRHRAARPAVAGGARAPAYAARRAHRDRGCGRGGRLVRRAHAHAARARRRRDRRLRRHHGGGGAAVRVTDRRARR